MSEEHWTIRHLDLADGPVSVEGPPRPHLIVYWWRSLPLGTRPLLAAEIPYRRELVMEDAARLAADQIHARRRLRHAGYDAIPKMSLSLTEALDAPDAPAALDEVAQAPEPTPMTLSIIVCTRDRPQMLQACLDSLERQAVAPTQVVIVDNSGDGNAGFVCAGRTAVTYVHEPRPGLSVARNAGIAAARGEIVAFTDDDVELPSGWTRELLRAFQSSDADAVTGLVLPARLDTPAQRAFELDLGGFTSRYFPLLFDQAFIEETKTIGPQVWRIGAGANMAFRRSVFARFGDFDERLGAGASGCSEDSEYWYRILAGGGSCLYEPRAVVHHHHRADWAGLRSQYRAYMRGHVAALVAQADRYGHRGNIRRALRQLPAYFARTAIASIQNTEWWRLRLVAEEILGWAEGLTYLANRRWRAAGQRSPTPVEAPQTQAVSHA